jgi:hypothetical protein
VMLVAHFSSTSLLYLSLLWSPLCSAWVESTRSNGCSKLWQSAINWCYSVDWPLSWTCYALQQLVSGNVRCQEFIAGRQ